MERSNVTMEGKSVELIGQSVGVGDEAPAFTAMSSDLETVKFSAQDNSPCIISSVVSLDTPVCDQQARRFNEEALELSEDLDIYVISMDLPFAQKRWCGAKGVDRVITLSDYRDKSFGKSYGLLLDGLQLLARSVMVVDSDGIIKYQEIVSEVTDHPNYDPLFDAVESVF